ncbi:MAG: chemotaxis protein CheB, partial [Moraxellaceae bacterium]
SWASARRSRPACSTCACGRSSSPSCCSSSRRSARALPGIPLLRWGIPNYLDRFAETVTSQPVNIAGQGSVLSDNTITLVTADRSINIYDNGTLVVGKSPWGGCYSPSIDQVTANVARVYRQRSGIIIFSGMGDDGAASCRLIKQQGGKVWVQSPEQSTIASMPEAAIATGTVSFAGTPPELADALARLKSTRQIKRYS